MAHTIMHTAVVALVRQQAILLQALDAIERASTLRAAVKVAQNARRIVERLPEPKPREESDDLPRS